MTSTAALDIARRYHEAWTHDDLDEALELVADDIVCEAPSGPIDGIEAYRAFLGPFAKRLTGVENVASFGDDTSAVLVYFPHTAETTSASTAEYFTVADGRIVRSLLVFDRLAFQAPSS